MATISTSKRLGNKVPMLAPTFLKVSRTYLKAQAFFLVIALLLAPIVFDYFFDFQLRTQAILFSLGTISCLVLVSRLTMWSIWSATAVYTFIFALFHFGILFIFALGIPIPNDFAIVLNRWFYTFFTERAMQLAFIGLLALITGVSLGLLLFTSSKKDQSTPNSTEKNPYHDSAFTLVGFFLTFSGIVSWFGLVISSGGIQLLVGSYFDYLELATRSGLTAFIYFAIGLGLPLLVMTSPSKLRTFGIILTGIWVFFAFPLGLRGEILFPLSASAIILAKQGQIRSTFKGIIAALLLLSVIAFVRELRQYGLAEYSFTRIVFSPAEGLLELGGSLRPVVEVVRWNASGEALIYGASYWAPFERALARVLPVLNIERLPAGEDLRLLNVLVQQRVGPIGFSPVAEAFRNFGQWGVMIYMLLLGMLFSWFDTRPISPKHLAIFVAISMPLFVQVRNAFTQVPAQIVFGLVIVLITLFWSNARYQEDRRRYHLRHRI